MIAPIQQPTKYTTSYGYKTKEENTFRKCPKCGNEYHGNHPLFDSGIINFATNKNIDNLNFSEHPYFKCEKCGETMEEVTTTTWHYFDKDGNELEKEPLTKKKERIINKFIDFFYDDVITQTETDEEGNYVGMRTTTKKELNWFKVGACSTSVTLMLIGAIIMLIKKHK